MTAYSLLKIQITEIATCPICLEDFTDPTSLPCVHSFCFKCLQRHLADCRPQDDVPCPLCRTEFRIPQSGLDGLKTNFFGLKTNFFLQNLVDAKNDSAANSEAEPCEACSTDEEFQHATMYCVDCAQKLCERCSLPHKKMRGPHDVRKLGDEVKAQEIWRHRTYCDNHCDKRLELFCLDCKVNICLKCSAVLHRQHQWEEIKKSRERIC